MATIENVNAPNALQEQFFTPDELAKLLKLHPSTIRRLFVDEPGVLRYGHAGLHGKKQYFSLRIPASVVQRVVGRMRVSG
jgi:hypothetical protein